VDAEDQAAAEESGLSYDDVKDTCFAWLVLVNKLEQAKWVPHFVGRSDVYIVNKVGGLVRKNRVVGRNSFSTTFIDPTNHMFSECFATSSTTTKLVILPSQLSHTAS
jgi:hypothetical protein